MLKKINKDFAKEIAKANEPGENTSDSESEASKETTTKRKKKMVSFNTRIPKKRDTLSKENSAYNRAVGKNKYPTEDQVFSDSESESSTDTE